MRGDTIAGLLITIIQHLGGPVIGVGQEGMDFLDAFQTYTLLLTVGDGLVTQIPALIVSTAAGLMVSKAGIEGSADKAMFGQLSFYPQALRHGLVHVGRDGAAAGRADVHLPRHFGRRRLRRPSSPAACAASAEAAKGPGRAHRRRRARPPRPISSFLAIDHLQDQNWAAACCRSSTTRGYRLTDQIKALRRRDCHRSRLRRHALGAHPRQHAARGQEYRIP